MSPSRATITHSPSIDTEPHALPTLRYDESVSARVSIGARFPKRTAATCVLVASWQARRQPQSRFRLMRNVASRCRPPLRSLRHRNFFLERCHYTAAVAWLLSSSIPRLPWYDSLLCAQVPSRRRVGGRSRRALRHAHADTKLFLGIALAREGALGGHAARTMTTFVSQRRAFLPLPAPLLRSLSRNSMGLAETRPAADVPTREEPCIQTQRQKPGNTA